jgi:hypothetical protein
MSDQQKTGIGVVLDLEELFLSREFGRKPARSVQSAPAAVASEPAHLEQVFLSEVFGHPEVVAAATQAVVGAAPAAPARPTLVLLQGGGGGSYEHDSTRARAIAAVSGVAAAALAVAGLTAGTGQGPGRPPVTAQAQGKPGPVGGSQPGTAGPNVPPGSSSAGTAGGEGTNASLTSFSPPVAGVVPPGTTVSGPTTPPAPGASSGGPTPGPPSGGGGGGSMLAPALDIVGNEVSSVGSSVTAPSGILGQALPVSSALQALGAVTTSATNNVSGGSPPSIPGAV